jgi:hypothetical protein
LEKPKPKASVHQKEPIPKIPEKEVKLEIKEREKHFNPPKETKK